jgi:hypothetical protein
VAHLEALADSFLSFWEIISKEIQAKAPIKPTKVLFSLKLAQLAQPAGPECIWQKVGNG